MTNLSILRSRDITLPAKVHLVKAMVFSSSHVWMWEFDYKESWAPKHWCFWTVVLEKTLESPFNCKDIQPVHSKGDQSWIVIGRTDAEAETPILWLPDVKNWSFWTIVLEKTLKSPWTERRSKRSILKDDAVKVLHSVQFSRSVVSESLQPHGLQHSRHPCPSPTPRVYSTSCLLSRWCHWCYCWCKSQRLSWQLLQGGN